VAAIAAGCGTIGGWMAASLAWRAESRREWAGTIFGLAALAVILGAAMIGVAGVALAQGGIAEPPMKALVVAVAGGVAIAVVGIAIYGVFVLPFTIVAASIWAAVMWLVRRRWRVTRTAP
jgi:hypothetical protein